MPATCDGGACARAVPVTPGLAPRIAVGLPPCTERLGGREAQSMAFFSTPLEPIENQVIPIRRGLRQPV